MKGFINIYKPAGISSAAVVSAVKQKFHVPCGHMGTLDPMAEGILPVGLYKTTRLFPYLLNKDKRYVARFKFGVTTDTLDVTGEVTERTGVVPDERTIISVLPRFIGEIEQIPPKYSAKCVDGKRGYQLARQGVSFELAPKTVTVNDIKLTRKTADDEYEFVIACKGGTYIRSLARDIGVASGTVAVMSALARVKSGAFDESNSVTLDDFRNSDTPEAFIIPPDSAVDFEKLTLTQAQATKILNGVFENYGFKDGIYRVYNEREFWGIGETKEGILKIKAYVR